MDPLTKDLLHLPVPQLVMKGEVNAAMYKEVSDCLLYLTSKQSPDIEIIIDSNGGMAKFGRHIYDVVRLYKGKTTGLVPAKAFSAATYALQACTYRKCARYSQILIHNPSTGDGLRLEQLTNKKHLDKIITDMKISRDKMVEIYLQRTGKTASQIMRQLDKDTIMTAEESLAFGLIDEIV
jgi:ATP-dependent Clp protease protease subunit